MNINLEFQEAYKRLDKLCRECFDSETGVTEYLRLMELDNALGDRYVITWENDYKNLKHIRWLRNQLSHEVGTLQSDFCSEEDLEFAVNFYERILNGSDPLTKLKKATGNTRKPKDDAEDFSDSNLKENKKSGLRKIFERIKKFFS